MTAARSRVSLLLACILPIVAFATPHVDESGPLELRLDYDDATRAALEQGSLKFGDPLKLVASFRVPANPKGVRVELLVSPMDVELADEQQQGQPYQGKDSAVEPGSLVFSTDLSNAKPFDRILIGLRVVPKGRRGSGLRATLRASGRSTEVGFAGRVFAADASGHVRATSFTALANEQHQLLTVDLAEQKRNLLPTAVLPFDEQRFAADLKTQSELVEGLKEDAP
jgi:hypothetical protein